MALQEAFERADDDGSGTLDKAELRVFLGGLTGEKVGSEELDGAFERLLELDRELRKEALHRAYLAGLEGAERAAGLTEAGVGAALAWLGSPPEGIQYLRGTGVGRPYEQMAALMQSKRRRSFSYVGSLPPTASSVKVPQEQLVSEAALSKWFWLERDGEWDDDRCVPHRRSSWHNHTPAQPVALAIRFRVVRPSGVQSRHFILWAIAWMVQRRAGGLRPRRRRQRRHPRHRRGGRGRRSRR